MLKLHFRTDQVDQRQIIHLPASKSISNRLSIINALAQKELPISNWSDAEDSTLMRNILNSKESDLDAGMAGTVIRFLTAYFAIQEGREVLLKGSERLHQRPIKPLVDTLQDLGADIQYLEKAGYPPLKIKGKKLKGSSLGIDASLSSQFVTALLLIAPYLKGGLELNVIDPTSRPYIEMTLSMMSLCGIDCEWTNGQIAIKEGEYQLSESYEIEADWSSAAFIYQYFALSDLTELKISNLRSDSMQGDRKCIEYFEKVGVRSCFEKEGVRLIRTSFQKKALEIDMSDQPDLILPFAFTAIFQLPSVRIKGIQTLRIKESDRVKALTTELEKLASINYESDKGSILLQLKHKRPEVEQLSSHNDHRMAMSLAPLCLLYNKLELDDGVVVRKSFPGFWNEVGKLGIVSEA
jgi:3-phosphoshikimate 1-carboxyvinyltransferase